MYKVLPSLSTKVVCDIFCSTPVSDQPLAIDHPLSHCPALHKLANAIEYKAMHNAAREGDIQRCHPKTRRAILRQISDWIDNPSPDSQILWLRGAVGVGKTAVVRTICETLNEQGRLAGDFFFCRVGGISKANTLFATIACQLAIAAPEIRQKIHEAFEVDPTVIYKAIEVQLRKLIVEPLLCLFQNHPETLPFVIAIDGLDECQSRRDQCDIIRILGSVSRAYQPPLPIRFIICSRPESWIRAGFDSVTIREITLEDNAQARRDIRMYLEDEFGKILAGPQHKSKMSYVQTPWPSTEELDALVSKSSGQFIYASTVIKFVSDLHYRPDDRLKSVLAIPTSTVTASQTSKPFEDLDRLYVQILSAVPPDLKKRTLDVLGALAIRTDVSCLNFKAEILDIAEVLLGLLPGEGYGALQALYSIVRVPDSIGNMRETMTATQYCQWSSGSPIVKFHHLSFVDFLLTEARSRHTCVEPPPHRHDQTCVYDFFVDRKDIHRRLALGCLKLLKGLSSDFAPRLHYGDTISATPLHHSDNPLQLHGTTL